MTSVGAANSVNWRQKVRFRSNFGLSNKGQFMRGAPIEPNSHPIGEPNQDKAGVILASDRHDVFAIAIQRAGKYLAIQEKEAP